MKNIQQKRQLLLAHDHYSFSKLPNENTFVCLEANISREIEATTILRTSYNLASFALVALLSLVQVGCSANRILRADFSVPVLCNRQAYGFIHISSEQIALHNKLMSIVECPTSTV